MLYFIKDTCNIVSILFSPIEGNKFKRKIGNMLARGWFITYLLILMSLLWLHLHPFIRDHSRRNITYKNSCTNDYF